MRGEEIYGRANTVKMYMSHEFLKEITDDFSDKRIVGRGTFGTVYLVRSSASFYTNHSAVYVFGVHFFFKHYLSL